jgi:hypothetical protein
MIVVMLVTLGLTVFTGMATAVGEGVGIPFLGRLPDRFSAASAEDTKGDTTRMRKTIITNDTTMMTSPGRGSMFNSLRCGRLAAGYQASGTLVLWQGGRSLAPEG